MPSCAIYLPDDVATELEEIRARRRPVPSMNSVINEILFDGLPTDIQYTLRLRRRQLAEGGSSR